MPTMRAVVIGAGIVGASCAYHLARAGARVTLLERGDHPAGGSTGRSAAGIRHQFSLAENVRFSRYSSAALDRFEREIGGHAGYRRVGYLFLVPPSECEVWQLQLSLQRSLGVRVDWLDPEQAAARFPYLDPHGLAGASFGPDDGVLDPHGITLGYLAAARRLGVEVQLRAGVTSLERRRGRWRVGVGADRIDADAVVNAAGAWSAEIAALAGISLPVEAYRRNVYLTGPLPALRHPTPLTIDVATGVYLRSEGERVLLGCSNPDQPPGFDVSVDWSWLDTVLERALPRFPFLAEATLDRRGSWAGLYAITPDHLPILGASAGYEGLIHACGFSGHGVQHAPATGLAVTEVALRVESPTFDLTRFRPERFGGATGSTERNIV
jgi:sarcosine oxidase subunit beta